MIGRTIALAGGLVGAIGLSQFPEFSQQYRQRLGGAVDELRVVVADFDASAAGAGLTREEALAQLVGTAFLEARATDMRRVFARSERLSADLAALEGAGPFLRLYEVGRFHDSFILARAWQAYRPAVPLTFEGLVMAGMGALAGFSGVRLVLGAFSGLFARLRRYAGGTVT